MKKTPANPYPFSIFISLLYLILAKEYNQGYDFTYNINGVEAKELTLHRGVNYTFIVRKQCKYFEKDTNGYVGSGIVRSSWRGDSDFECFGDVTR